MEGVPELDRVFAFFLGCSSLSELESMMDSRLGVFSFDPILRARAVHSTLSKRGCHITVHHTPTANIHSPKDSCKKSSNFNIIFFSKWSFPKKASKLFPSVIVP
jgi:hypothetical protein